MYMTVYLVFGSIIPYAVTILTLLKMTALKRNLEHKFTVLFNQHYISSSNLETCKELNNSFLLLLCMLAGVYIIPSMILDIYIFTVSMDLVSLSKTIEVYYILIAIKLNIPCIASLTNILIIEEPRKTLQCSYKNENKIQKNVITIGINNKRFIYD